MNLRLFLYLWVALAVVVFALFIRRKMVASHEDDSLHVLDGGGGDQTVVAQKLDQIDRWGKILTVVMVIYGVLLGAAYAYQAWIQTSQTGV